MLRVKLDLVPWGVSDEAREIGAMEIANLRERNNIADYLIIIDGNKVGKVKGFDRSKGPWALVEKALGVVPVDLQKGLLKEEPPKPTVDFIEQLEKKLGE